MLFPRRGTRLFRLLPHVGCSIIFFYLSLLIAILAEQLTCHFNFSVATSMAARISKAKYKP
jgi:hypothetical protein